MTGPATTITSGATAAATASVWGSAGGWAILNSLVPPGLGLGTFFVDILITIFGAFCYQFVYTQYLRQAAADKGVPTNERPRIDGTTLGYAMCGAPMATAAWSYFVHLLGGMADGYSIPGYMAAGAMAPWIVNLFLGAIKRLVSLKAGGDK